jgi:hypothetical protein
MEGNTNSKAKLKMMQWPGHEVDVGIEEVGERVMWRERCSEGRCERWRVASRHEDQQRSVKNEDGEN